MASVSEAGGEGDIILAVLPPLLPHCFQQCFRFRKRPTDLGDVGGFSCFGFHMCVKQMNGAEKFARAASLGASRQKVIYGVPGWRVGLAATAVLSYGIVLAASSRVLVTFQTGWAWLGKMTRQGSVVLKATN